LKIGNVDHAIYKSLLEEGKLTYNRLHSKTQEHEKCTVRTYNKHLKQLVEDRMIIRQKKGKQLVEFSINHDVSQPVQNTLDFLQKSIESMQEGYITVELFFKKYPKADNDTQKLISKKFNIFEICDNIVTNSLFMSHWCSVFLTSGLLARIQKNKFKNLQQLALNLAEKTMESVKNYNFQAYIYLFNLVANKMDPIQSVNASKSS